MSTKGQKQDFRVIIEHYGFMSEPFWRSFLSPDTAIKWAREATVSGARVAKVVRKSDGVVIYDGPGEVQLAISEWYA